MEGFIQGLIYIHAAFGGMALLAGLVSIIVTKGGEAHKKSGLVFYYSMMSSGIIALLISVMPNHGNYFLFTVGIFSLYFVITGKRTLNFKKQSYDVKLDKLISVIMIITCVCMILLSVMFTENVNKVLLVFGIIGILYCVWDLTLFSRPDQLKDIWLKLHIRKMLASYIAATTAFVIVNDFFPGISGWFIPGIIGEIIINYWIRKTHKKRTPDSVDR